MMVDVERRRGVNDGMKEEGSTLHACVYEVHVLDLIIVDRLAKVLLTFNMKW